MNFHLGRLIDHVQLVVSDLATSKRFYRAVLQSLGRDLTGEGDGYFFVDELFVSETEGGGPVSRVHIAFQAPDRQTVQRFHAASVVVTPGGINGVARVTPGRLSLPAITSSTPIYRTSITGHRMHPHAVGLSAAAVPSARCLRAHDCA